MTRPTIHVGSKGQAVKDAQKALLDRGYFFDPVEVDGVFGPKTLHAVRAYQLDRDKTSTWGFSWPLDVDGIVGPFTWGRLDPEVVKKGSQGPTVRLLQSILKFLDPAYDPGPIDGIFGNQTESALKAFQADYGLTVDGIAGPETWLALWS